MTCVFSCVMPCVFSCVTSPLVKGYSYGICGPFCVLFCMFWRKLATLRLKCEAIHEYVCGGLLGKSAMHDTASEADCPEENFEGMSLGRYHGLMQVSEGVWRVIFCHNAVVVLCGVMLRLHCGLCWLCNLVFVKQVFKWPTEIRRKIGGNLNCRGNNPLNKSSRIWNCRLRIFRIP